MDGFNDGLVLPTLIRQLKSILDQYPDDGQILKEVIQNAEDAGAKRIIFLIDQSTYGTDPNQLYDRRLAFFQGPALYAYNDASFKDEDWTGLRLLQESIKEKDPMKVGRFGLGFKSVFHMTDLPSVFSDKGIAFIDPHMEYFKKLDRQGRPTGVPTSSFLFHLESDREQIAKLRHQFEPFVQDLFESSQSFSRGQFKGTVFRFPFRQIGNQSDLSSTVYDVNKIKSLVQSLISDAHHMLLFLKNVESIQVFEKKSPADKNPHQLLDIRISKPYLDTLSEQRLRLKAKMEELKEKMKQRTSGLSQETAFKSTYPLGVQVVKSDGGKSVTSTTQWIVSQYVAGKEDFTGLSADNIEQGYLPIVGSAIQVEEKDEDLCTKKPGGHIFCFLPLPLEEKSPTGLRFHVHGCFAVDQNRRHLKWPSADQKGQLRDPALIWNQFLVRSVLPKAMAEMVSFIIKLQRKDAAVVRMIPNEMKKIISENLQHNPEFLARLVYAILPDKTTVTPQWGLLVDVFEKEISSNRLTDVFYSLPTDSWSHWQGVIFDNLLDVDEYSQVVRKVLHESRSSVAFVPTYVKKLLPPTAVSVKAEHISKGMRIIQHVNFSDVERSRLLDYLIGHLDDLRELLDLELLPLANGEWIKFKPASQKVDNVYVECNEHPRCLLPGLDRKFVLTARLGKKCQGIMEITQISELNSKAVFQLLPELFKPWHGRVEIPVSETARVGLDQRWLSLIWRYLQQHSPSKLDDFQGLHLMPLSDEITTILDRTVPIIARTDTYIFNLFSASSPLPSDIVTVCQALNIKVIDNVAQEIRNHPQVWKNYIQPPSVEGLLAALTKVVEKKGRDGVSVLFSSLSDRCRLQFRQFIAKDIKGLLLSETVKDVLKRLPIFLTVDNSGKRKAHFVSIQQVSIAAPTDTQLIIPVVSSDLLLNLQDNSSVAVSQVLGVRPPTVPGILINVYFPAIRNNAYSDDEVVKLMKFVCQHVKEFRQIDSHHHITESCSQVKFISTNDGAFVRPIDMFDPHEPLLKKIFVHENVFPVGEFAKIQYRESLLLMGLKTCDKVSADDVLRVAESLPTVNPQQTDIASSLMSLLNRRLDLLDQPVKHSRVLLRDRLMSLRWIPVHKERPQGKFPKSLNFAGQHVDNNGLAAPSEIRSLSQACLIGSVKPLVYVKDIAALANIFQWNADPALEDVAEHLMNTVKCYSPEEKVSVQNTVHEIYRFLNERENRIDQWLSIVTGQKWIWNDDGFGDTSQFVLRKDFIDLRPYRFTLPSSSNQFRALWKKCAFKENSDLPEVLEAIQRAHLKHDGVADADAERDIPLSINILNHLAEKVVGSQSSQQLLIPVNTKDGSLLMKPLLDCACCDKEWYQKGFDVADIDENVFLIHDRKPLKTAEALGIPSLISRTLGVESLAIGFGQTEPLTTRLKSLLRDYTDGLAVFKELIQNADDAGATEMHFLYDERANEDCCNILLDQGMKSLQGPALWTYNNAVFKDEDFDNIIKLSGATKEMSGDKVGRFGLGFNAVYNLTDVPSFISRSSIVFFDPHLEYLGRSLPDRSKPGIKLNLETHRSKIQRLDDQFKPYNGIFGCDLSPNSAMESYEGTLFRFPLRTREQALRSKISQMCYTDDEMRKLIQLLEKAANHLLLYTQNLRKINVFHLASDCSTPQDMVALFCIERKLESIIRNVISDGRLTFTSTVSEGFLRTAKRLITEYKGEEGAIGSGNKPSFAKTLIYGVSISYSQADGRSLQSSQKTSTCYWMVSSCMGSGRSFSSALKDSSLVPVGGVAAQLEKIDKSQYTVFNSEKLSESYGMVFCSMPLPIKYPLPVYINGYFAVNSSRTSLYEPAALDKLDKRAVWNKELIEDAVAQAYCNLLLDLKQVCPGESSYPVWPTLKSLKEAGCLSGCLIKSFYERICTSECNLDVIKSVNGWTQFERCRMLSPQFGETELARTALNVLQKIFTQDFAAVDIPTEVIETILQTEVAHEARSKFIEKASFYREFFLPNIRDVDAVQRDLLVLHCLFDDKLQHYLKDFYCIPVSSDIRELRRIQDTVHPESKLACLYDEDEQVFPFWDSGVADDKQYRQQIYAKLVSLGMKKDRLTWEELADRCQVIQSNPETAGKRTKLITGLMNENLKDGLKPTEPVLQRCRRYKYFLVAKRPTSFPVKWKGDNYRNDELISSDQSFLFAWKDLVCSSFPVIDEKRSFPSDCNELKTCLGLTAKGVPPEVVINQLAELVIAADEMKHATKSENLSFFQQIYTNSMEYMRKCVKKMPPATMKVHIERLTEQRCILIDKTLLMFPNRCAMVCNTWSDLMLPQLALIPAGRTEAFGELFMVLGVKDKFTVLDYKMLLEDLQCRTLSRKLTPHELNVALHVINHGIYNEFEQSTDRGSLQTSLTDLPVPNAADELCPVHALCFNNCPWLVSSTDTNFCNTRISHPVAEAIGVKTQRENMVSERRIAKPFGQKEPLVKRIKRILESYPFSEDVLKEMLQNADDSGATEIRFIIDNRKLPDEKLFSDSWKALQGAALCVYNNRSFTEADLDGIQNLGEGSKSDDPTKTGQYGVGFNSVYHVTDVPTFLTSVDGVGKLLCAFDPNCKYVPGSNSQDSGGMFVVDDSTEQSFCDVFAGYLQKRYDITKTGTVFRLPIRHESMAEKSEISKKVVGMKTLENMFDTFRTDACEALLFVNSVEQICLEEVVDSTDGVRTSYTASVRLSDDAKRKKESFRARISEYSGKLRRGEVQLQDVPVKEICYEAIVEDSDGSNDTWEVVQRFGFEDTYNIPSSVTDSRRTGDLGCLPIGGVAYLKKSSRNRDKHKNRLFSFLPLPVMLEKFPVSVNGHFVLDHESRRNLWTDDKETYKFVWNKCLMEGVIAPAYCTLIVRVRDNLKKTENVSKDEGKVMMNQYFNLFPNIGVTSAPLIDCLTKALYKYVADENKDLLPLFSKAKKLESLKWMSPLGQSNKKAYFDDLKTQLLERSSTPSVVFRSATLTGYGTSSTNRSNVETPSVDTIIRHTLTRCGLILFNCPIRICEQFELAEVFVERVSPQAVFDFFGQFGKKGSFCKLNNVLPVALSETPFKDIYSIIAVLKYISKAKNYKSGLELKPLLVTADLQLRQFDRNNVAFVTNYCDVAPHALDLFVHSCVANALDLKPDEDVTLCRAFKIGDFTDLLSRLLPTDQFIGSDKSIPLTVLSEILQKHPVGLHWLTVLWRFITSCVPSEGLSREMLDSLLLPLRDWCLLPVTCGSVETLLPIGKSRGVLWLHDFNSTEFDKILGKLGVAEPSTQYVLDVLRTSPKSLDVLKTLLGCSGDPECVFSALNILYERKVSLSSLLEARQGLKVLEVISENMDKLSKVPHAKELIRNLPFFVSIFNTQLPLTCQEVYVVPQNLPKDGIENWARERGVIFLKEVSNIGDLLEFVDGKTLSVLEVYRSLIFERFSWLSRDDQLAHMKFVRDHVMKLSPDIVSEKQEYTTMTECLKRFAFIPCKMNENVLVVASQYYDRSNKVFSTVLSDEKFPPEPFNDGEWEEFLKLCGLICDVTQDMFVSYITLVQSQSFQHQKEQSDVLLEHLVRRKDLDPAFLDRIKRIAFIQPCLVGRTYTELHYQLGRVIPSNDQLLLVPLEGSVLNKYQYLVWTKQHCLPHAVNKQYFHHDENNTFETIMQNLGVDVKPKAIVVAKHTKRLCSKIHAAGESFFSDFERINLLNKILVDIYKYLMSCGDLDENVIAVLARTPCICMHESMQLLRPCFFAVELPEEHAIKPYLNKFPRHLGSYLKLFLKLGTQTNPTVQQYADVLTAIQVKANDKELDKNEQREVLDAVRGLLHLICKIPDVKLDSKLYLPSTSGKLSMSSSLVYVDDGSLRSRLKDFNEEFLVDLKQCGMDDQLVAMSLKKLPPPHQPRFLTSLVFEYLDSTCGEQPCDLAKRMRKRISSPVFRNGYERVLRHELSGCSLTKQQIKETLEQSLNGLNLVSLCGKRQIKTCLQYDGEKIPNSDRTLNYFGEKIEQNGRIEWTIHVQSDFSGDTDFYSAVASVITKASTADSVHLVNVGPSLATIMDCSIDQIHNVLDRRGIKQLNNDMRDSELLRFNRAVLGDFVHQNTLGLLIQNMYLFQSGWLVAMETDDPLDRGEACAPTFIYVQIVRKELTDASSDVGETYIVKISEDGDDIKVQANALYAFRRPEPEAASRAVVLHPLCDEQQIEHPLLNESEDLDTIIEDLKRKLTEAWKLPEDQRKRVIRRLQLTWHPDKNHPHRVELCTRVFQLLANLIRILENGGSIDDVSEEEAAGASSARSQSSSDFDDIFRQRARNYSQQEYYWRDNCRSSSRRNNQSDWTSGRRHRDFEDMFTEFRQAENPQPGEAKRWMRQAKFDLEATRKEQAYDWICQKCFQAKRWMRQAKFDLEATRKEQAYDWICQKCFQAKRWMRQAKFDLEATRKEQAYDWICQKCFQAVEKALRACQYSRDAKYDFPRSGDSLRCTVDDDQIEELTRQLQQLLPSSSFLKYPSSHTFPNIPRMVLGEDTSEQAIQLSTQIIQLCQVFIDRAPTSGCE